MTNSAGLAVRCRMRVMPRSRSGSLASRRGRAARGLVGPAPCSQAGSAGADACLAAYGKSQAAASWNLKAAALPMSGHQLPLLHAPSAQVQEHEALWHMPYIPSPAAHLRDCKQFRDRICIACCRSCWQQQPAVRGRTILIHGACHVQQLLHGVQPLLNLLHAPEAQVQQIR